MSDIDGVRPSDPGPSHEARERTETEAGRAFSFQVLCDILDGVVPAIVLGLDGLPLLTRKILKVTVALYYAQNDTKATTKRRRVSDLMTQVWKGGRWEPLVHFDLFEQVLKPDGKQLMENGAGVIRLTFKGQWWKDHPEVRDWRWPHYWDGVAVPMDWDGVEVPME